MKRKEDNNKADVTRTDTFKTSYSGEQAIIILLEVYCCSSLNYRLTNHP
jgi:hypothetical protein